MQKKSYAKVNIFLKITGKRDNYHLLASRFVRVHSLFDLISFEKEENEDFTLKGTFGCETKKNTIYKAYILLKDKFPHLEKEFKQITVKVTKNIPEFAGLGGGSSNCATFLLMCNEYFNLDLSKNDLCEIAQKIGADVPFFVYEYDSANVSGVGEIVEKFDEEILDIETYTPKVKCETPSIFKTFRDKFFHLTSKEESDRLFKMKSLDILKKLNIKEANDLYSPAAFLYKELENNKKDFCHFSGSGSTFFKVNNG